MRNRIIWTVAMTMLTLVAVFFVAGDFSVFEWSAPDRFLMVMSIIAVAGLTASCPYIKERE
jgi:CHASE2 domain-containing sensor protein